MTTIALTEGERDLLEWLGETEFSQYGECYGAKLDRLMALGLARMHGPHEHQNGFIAKEPPTLGDHKMYRAVSLTKEGRALLRGLPKRSR